MHRFSALLFLGVLSFTSWSGPDDLAGLSDEFDDASTISDWMRVHLVEQWNADQLEIWDIDTSQPGWMTMVPYTSSWYENYRGVLAFKLVEGDFVVTTRVRPRRRDGSAGAPNSQFSLAGILVRAPRNITPETWTPGGENYVFLSMGAAGDPGVYQFEVKTTEDSVSTLQYENIAATETEIRVARIGPHLILLRRTPGAEWSIHRRYLREDFPATLQAGLTCYTDWPNVQVLDPFFHNGAVITEGNPDLRAEFDFVRYSRPMIPPPLIGAQFSDSELVSDEAILAFLGDAADATPTTTSTPTATSTQAVEDPTPTQSPTSTETQAPSPSFTQSETETNTPTPTASVTSTATLTPTDTASATPSATGAPSETPTSSPSESPLPTPSTTPTETIHPTPTVTPTEDFDFDDDLDVDAEDLLILLGGSSGSDNRSASVFAFSAGWNQKD